jgi:threonine/homoserine/homoserine lactone efflux protein
MGFVAAIPVGGTQIEIAKRMLSGNRVAATMIIAGSVLPNLAFGAVAVFGFAPYLQIPWVMGTANAVGAVALMILGVLTVRESRRPGGVDLASTALGDQRRAFLTGLTLTLGTPSLILMWLFGAALLIRSGLASPGNIVDSLFLLAGGTVGLAAYPSLLALLVGRFKKMLPPSAVNRVYFWLGLALLVMSLYFVYGAIQYFLLGSV